MKETKKGPKKISDQGGPPRPLDAISIESNGISNRSNRKSQKSSNGRKIARMARILMIFGPFEPHQRQLQFPKISNERKIIESIESIDSIERSRDRSYRPEAAMFSQDHVQRSIAQTNTGCRMLDLRRQTPCKCLFAAFGMLVMCCFIQCANDPS